MVHAEKGPPECILVGSFGEFALTCGVLIFLKIFIGLAQAQDFFFFAPPPPPPPYPYDFYDPYPYYETNPYQNYEARPYREPRQRNLGKKARRKVVNEPRSAKPQRKAVALTVSPSKAVTCDKAQTIIAEYGFSEIVPKSCSGRTRDFRAMRDGKAFEVRVLASNGELEKVQKLR